MPKITIPILADGDQERLSELHRAVNVAERALLVAERDARTAAAAPLRGGDPLPTGEVDDARAELKAAQAAYDAFLDEAAERGESWVLESIGFREFRNLLKEHPPRTVVKKDDEGNEVEVTHEDDEAYGVNEETFGEALLLFDEDDIRTVAELKVGRTNIANDPAKLRKRIKRLSEGQFEKLWHEAYVLNKVGVSDPKFDRFSTGTPRSNET